MDAVVIDAHGKINLTLDVLQRRPDGYHDIKSVMQSIGLADRLVLKQGEGISLETNIPITTTRDNLAWKAADLFINTMDIKEGVDIKLTKNLPLSAGLAGGSADAAGVLWGLNILYQTNLSLEELQKMGKVLGADVPFCLQGGTLLAEGIGERLTQLPAIPQYFIVLVKPNKSVSTKKVYQGLQKDMFGEGYTTAFVERLLLEQDVASYCGNVLQQVTSTFVAEVGIWQERMLQAGAKAGLMSGSGPTVFGLFAKEADARMFCEEWEHQGRWMAWTTPARAGISQLKE